MPRAVVLPGFAGLVKSEVSKLAVSEREDRVTITLSATDGDRAVVIEELQRLVNKLRDEDKDDE